ncbi:MAG: sigma-70 family RNA polymerase sigma factor [Candidatus Pacebacteria bacterium]|nr:sigma-70 family RNA polymerase sigma factor [Candidatus Paceibacterota bacterium]
MAAKTTRIKRLTKKKKDEAAKNVPLAKHIAKKMGWRDLPMEDQIQEASVGLCKAVNGFDPSRGTKLSTMIGRCAMNEILSARRKYGLIRIPDYLQEKANAEHGLQKHVKQAGKRLSIDGISEDSEFHPRCPEDDDSEFGWKAMRAVRWAVQKLPPIERDVIRGLMFRQETARELGKKHGVHVSVVRHLKDTALAKLRASLVKHV